MSGKDMCSIPGCGRVLHARTYCRAHYQRMRLYGSPHYTMKRSTPFVIESSAIGRTVKTRSEAPTSCFMADCDRPVFARSVCRGHYKRVYDLAKRYHKTIEWFVETLAAQRGLCAICRERPATDVDHDHTCCDDTTTCGRCIRGLLCRGCNSGLGRLHDENVAAALVYLTQHKMAMDAWRDEIKEQTA